MHNVPRCFSLINNISIIVSFQESIKSSDCNVRLEFRDDGIWIRHSYLKNGQFKITKGKETFLNN